LCYLCFIISSFLLFFNSPFVERVFLSPPHFFPFSGEETPQCLWFAPPIRLITVVRGSLGFRRKDGYQFDFFLPVIYLSPFENSFFFFRVTCGRISLDPEFGAPGFFSPDPGAQCRSWSPFFRLSHIVWFSFLSSGLEKLLGSFSDPPSLPRLVEFQPPPSVR